MILFAVDLESSLETTSNFVGRGEDGIDVSIKKFVGSNIYVGSDIQMRRHVYMIHDGK